MAWARGWGDLGPGAAVSPSSDGREEVGGVPREMYTARLFEPGGSTRTSQLWVGSQGEQSDEPRAGYQISPEESGAPLSPAGAVAASHARTLAFRSPRRASPSGRCASRSRVLHGHEQLFAAKYVTLKSGQPTDRRSPPHGHHAVARAPAPARPIRFRPRGRRDAHGRECESRSKKAKHDGPLAKECRKAELRRMGWYALRHT